MQTKPDILSTRSPDKLREALEITLAHVTFVTERVGKINVRMLSADDFHSDEIEVLSDITDIIPPMEGQAARKDFVCTVGLSGSVSSFAEKLDAHEVWRIAENEAEMSAAVSIKARSLRKYRDVPLRGKTVTSLRWAVPF
jgi:hypothetical protein